MTNAILISEFGELERLYPGIKIQISGETLVLTGEIAFYLSYPESGKPPIADVYSIEIRVPSGFPETLPIVSETGGKIKRPYEHVSNNGVLCLGIPSDLYLILKKSPSIQGFIENIVKPNLFAHSFYKRYGYMPWGERITGKYGVFCRYAEMFGIFDVAILLNFLRVLVEGDYRGNTNCPCRSGKTLNECHGEVIYRLWQIPWNYLIADYWFLEDFKLARETRNFLYRKF